MNHVVSEAYFTGAKFGDAHYFIHEMAVLKSFSKFLGRHMCGIVSLNLQAVSLLFLKKNSTVVVSAKSRYYVEKLFLLSGTG